MDKENMDMYHIILDRLDKIDSRLNVMEVKQNKTVWIR